MQVDPMKATLTVPGSKRLKLENQKTLSNFAFNFNLRRCTKVADAGAAVKEAKAGDDKAGGGIENSH